MSRNLETLVPVAAQQDAALYRLHDPQRETPLERFVVTSASTRALINQPEYVGSRFRNALMKGVRQGLEMLPFADEYRAITDDERFNVVHFLRGGLNFGLMGGLAEAFGCNSHRASFMTSERARDEEGRWFIREDQYMKLDVLPGSLLFAGDIVATGVTVAAGFAKIAEQVSGLPKDQLPPEIREFLFESIGEKAQADKTRPPKPATPLQEIVFVALGGHKIEKCLEVIHHFFKEQFPGYKRTTILYIEGKFHLADSKTPVHIKLQGTDLLRDPAVVAPEFFLSQYSSTSAPLERCIIYDGGSRSYHVRKHLHEVREYWEEVLTLATEEGWTLEQALKERWPETPFEEGFEAVQSWARERWPEIPDHQLETLWEAWGQRWTPMFRVFANNSKALERLCHRQIQKFTVPE